MPIFRTKKINQTFKTIRDVSLAILLCEGAGLLGAIFTTADSAWYSSLPKPELTPPDWLFAPVWTLLYALMGVAAWLVWQQGPQKRRVFVAMILFFIQLALNAWWSFIFFDQHSAGGALIDIVLLWVAILATIIAFARVSKAAAWLLLPYLAWVSFAAYLNWSIWLLNK